MSETLQVSFRGKRDVYEIVVTRNGRTVSISCSCPESQEGAICWHRVSVLLGDGKHLVGQRSDQLDTLKRWIAGTDLNSALKAFVAAQRQAETARQLLVRLMNGE